MPDPAALPAPMALGAAAPPFAVVPAAVPGVPAPVALVPPRLVVPGIPAVPAPPTGAVPVITGLAASLLPGAMAARGVAEEPVPAKPPCAVPMLGVVGPFAAAPFPDTAALEAPLFDGPAPTASPALVAPAVPGTPPPGELAPDAPPPVPAGDGEDAAVSVWLAG